MYSLQHKHTQGALAYSRPFTSLLHIQWLWYDNIRAYLPSCKLGPLGYTSSQPAGVGVCISLPLGLIYCPVLGCYCTELLLRAGVNCPALGSISNRTARDMGPDISKRWHYIIPRCFSKWSLQTPPYKSPIIQKKEARPALTGNVISSQHTGRDPAHLSWQNTLPPQLLLEDQWVCGVSVAIFYLNNYSII